MTNRTIHPKKHPRAPRISRARLRTMHDELNAAHEAVTDTYDKFWIIREGDIRDTLAATRRKIGRAMAMLRRAA